MTEPDGTALRVAMIGERSGLVRGAYFLLDGNVIKGVIVVAEVRHIGGSSRLFL